MVRCKTVPFLRVFNRCVLNRELYRAAKYKEWNRGSFPQFSQSYPQVVEIPGENYTIAVDYYNT